MCVGGDVEGHGRERDAYWVETRYEEEKGSKYGHDLRRCQTQIHVSTLDGVQCRSVW
jgi:hypothetical protein